MLKFSIKNLHTFYRIEERPDKYSYGCKQDWYPSDWQKRAGCGPTTACNLLSYMEFSSLGEKEQFSASKESRLSWMLEAWEYVTPTERGIPSTKMFCERFSDYAKVKGMEISCHCIDIAQEINERPEFQNIVEFIKAAMLKDFPVAFLNLCNGKVSNLDEWHWVTIVSLEHNMDNTEVYIDIIDEGCIEKIDLKLWYDTTTLGGGFVYYTRQ